MTYIETRDGDQNPVNKPGTHVFVIGVGEYPAMDKMKDPNNAYRRDFQMSAQLLSARDSAINVAEWFIRNYDDSSTPLRSVEMLLSPQTIFQHPDDPTNQITIEQANISQIEAAYLDWWKRCNSDTGNNAVFYFAGHGLDCATQLLLASDFLRNQMKPIAAAIDFNLSYIEMGRNRAKNQFYFIDACRDFNRKLTGGSKANLRVSDATILSYPASSNPLMPRNTLKLYATQVGKSAWGKSGGVSRFSEHLKAHLNGTGAVEIAPDDWIIQHKVFGDHLLASMVRENNLKYKNDRSKHQIPQSDPSTSLPPYSILCHLGNPPKIPVRLGCDPDIANPEADFTLFDMKKGTQDSNSKSAHGREPWETNLMAGDYTFEAKFDSGSSYRDNNFSIKANTPYTDYDLGV